MPVAVSYLAFDLGAESGRAMLGDFDGAAVRVREIHRAATRSVRLPDGLYWDALALFDDMLAGMRAAAGQGNKIRSIGIDSWAVDFGLLNQHGSLVANPLSYRDGRGAAAMESALARVPAAELYDITGIQLLPINTLFQLLALGDLESVATLLLIPDLLGFWLTGDIVAEATNASTTQLVDVRTGRWSTELIRRLELPERIFPTIVAPASHRSGLLPHVCEETRIAPITGVVSVASHDTASAVVASPLGPGSAFLSSGTWSLLGVELDEPVLTEEAWADNLTNEAGFGGTTRLLKNVMGLWLLQECRRAWELEGRGVDYATLIAEARAADESYLLDPDAPELLTPGNMPARIGQAAGVGPTTRGVIVRSILESLACKYRYVLEQLERATGLRLHTVNVVGGGAQNELLCQLTADVTVGASWPGRSRPLLSATRWSRCTRSATSVRSGGTRSRAGICAAGGVRAGGRPRSLGRALRKVLGNPATESGGVWTLSRRCERSGSNSPPGRSGTRARALPCSLSPGCRATRSRSSRCCAGTPPDGCRIVGGPPHSLGSRRRLR